MRLGIDFDNTIACYNTIFHRLAAERGLVPADPVLSKAQVRDLLRKQGREDDWTELQGYVYGPGMTQVETFPGVAACLRSLIEASVDVHIISHKTRTPYRGPAWDLRQAAQVWLEQQGFFDINRIGLSRDKVFFELTLAEKLQRITQQGCTHFLDDLPELLAEPGFPQGVHRLLFDPDRAHGGEPFERIHSWPELATWIHNHQ
jgi:hypothetical protein